MQISKAAKMLSENKHVPVTLYYLSNQSATSERLSTNYLLPASEVLRKLSKRDQGLFEIVTIFQLVIANFPYTCKFYFGY